MLYYKLFLSFCIPILPKRAYIRSFLFFYYSFTYTEGYCSYSISKPGMCIQHFTLSPQSSSHGIIIYSLNAHFIPLSMLMTILQPFQLFATICCHVTANNDPSHRLTNCLPPSSVIAFPPMTCLILHTAYCRMQVIAPLFLLKYL